MGAVDAARYENLLAVESLGAADAEIVELDGLDGLDGGRDDEKGGGHCQSQGKDVFLGFARRERVRHCRRRMFRGDSEWLKNKAAFYLGDIKVERRFLRENDLEANENAEYSGLVS
jgi:hypothetical protein